MTSCAKKASLFLRQFMGINSDAPIMAAIVTIDKLNSAVKKHIDTSVSCRALHSLQFATKDKHAVLDSSMPLAKTATEWRDYVDHLVMLGNWLTPLERWLITFNDGPQGLIRARFFSRIHLIAKNLADAKN